MSEPQNLPSPVLPSLVVFLSAVSDEFHKGDPLRPQAFLSYRDCLRTELSALGDIRVIVQEELHQGFGDLLSTLDRELPQCRIIVHLLGDMAGHPPTAAELRRLKERHQDLLDREPELRQAVGDGAGVTYTQWELYFAFHYQIDRLVFCATPATPRSPVAMPTDEDRTLQQRHLARVELTGEHRSPFHDQYHVALQIIRALKREGLFMLNPALTTTPQQVQAAREDMSAVVQEVAGHIKKPDSRVVPQPTPAGGNVIANAYRIVAESRGLTEQALVQLLEVSAREHEASVQEERTCQGLCEQALNSLALGDYHASMAQSREAADLALADWKAGVLPQLHDMQRGAVLNALLLHADAARLCHRREEALAALEEGGRLIDRAREPQFWASYHRMLGRALLVAGHYQRADPIIRAVRDIGEQHPGEQNEDLIAALLLLASLLKEQGNYRGVEVVTQRALNLAERQIPQNLRTIAVCFNFLGTVCNDDGRHDEAETIYRNALEIDRALLGPEDPNTLKSRNSLANTLERQEKHVEAELEHRAVLAIRERVLGPEHPDTLTSRNNLASTLNMQGKHVEAEAELRTVLALHERVLGPEHPDMLISRNNLAITLGGRGNHAEAELEHRAVLPIRERVLGPEHPDVFNSCYYLALCLERQQRMEEAKPYALRAYEGWMRVLGEAHPDTVKAWVLWDRLG